MNSESGGFPTVGPPTLEPAISPSVHLSLTIVYITLYSFLFLFVYIQLWLVLYYKYKRFSYQTVFLGLCLLWAGLRTSLFSFYFSNCVLANNLATVFYWLLYCFPVCLQFITLCLLVLFFAQVVFKARTKYEPNKYRKPLLIGLGAATAVFLVTNIACAVIVKKYQVRSDTTPAAVSMVRVVINDSLFIVCGAVLSFCIYKISKTTSASMVLEAKGTTVRQALAMCVMITLLYSSRALYNMIAVARPFSDMLNFGYGWINVSDQADFMNLDQGFAYISFGVVLFLWEFLPTFLVVLFFRVQRRRSEELPQLGPANNNKQNARAYFFDNPRRYDSDDDLSTARSFSPGRSNVFDSSLVINSGSDRVSSYSHGLPDTPPSIFTTSGSLQQSQEPQYYDGT